MKKIMLFLGLLLLVGCGKEKVELVDTMPSYVLLATDSALTITTDKTLELVTQKHPLKEATITAVGDIMVHQRQLTRGYDPTTATFDFSHAFKYISPFLSQGDYTLGNLETTLAGKDSAIILEESFYFHGYTGYPCFNTPEVLAENLKSAGFDMVSTANNHSLDSRVAGLFHTLDVLDDAGLDHVGTYRSQEEKEAYFIKEINGISFGFESYTYGTNGLPVPKTKPYTVNTLNMYQQVLIDQMASEVKALSEVVDIVVIAMHFGSEYHDYPDTYQQGLVDVLFEAGADVILGSHPHVLQPIEVRQIVKNGEERTGLVIYSLGNFLASQRYTVKRPKETDIGAIVDLHFEQIGDEAPRLKGISLTPTYTYWSAEEISVIPVIDYVVDPEKYNDLLDAYEIQRVNEAYEKTIGHLTSYLSKDYTQDYTQSSQYKIWFE